jgi:hypothetical protein
LRVSEEARAASAWTRQGLSFARGRGCETHPLRGQTETARAAEYSNQWVAETQAREPAEIQIRGVNFGIQPAGDGGDLRVGGQVSGGSGGFQQRVNGVSPIGSTLGVDISSNWSATHRDRGPL